MIGDGMCAMRTMMAPCPAASFGRAARGARPRRLAGRAWLVLAIGAQMAADTRAADLPGAAQATLRRSRSAASHAPGRAPRPGIGVSSVGNPRMFAGRSYEVQTGWYDSRTRDLDPRSGRFASGDARGTWADRGSLGNGTNYAHLRPTVLVDPWGEAAFQTAPCCCCCVDEPLRLVSAVHWGRGHDITWAAQLRHVEAAAEKAGDCTIEYWERTNKPYTKRTQAGKERQWWNMFDDPETPDLKESWGRRKRPCPGVEPWTFTDHTEFNRPGTRTLDFVVRIRSTPGCPCVHRETVVWAREVLSRRRDADDRVDGPQSALDVLAEFTQWDTRDAPEWPRAGP